MFHSVYDEWQNQTVCLHQLFVMISKSTTTTPEMLHEAIEEHFYNGQQFLNGMSVKYDKHLGQSCTCKMSENVEKIQELIHKDCYQTIHEVTGTAGISYGVYHEI
jgi:hypothetical protein